MAKALTALAIDKMKAPAARREIPDGKVPGLYLIVQPTGAMSWAVRYRYQGKSRKLTLGACPAIGLNGARKLAGQALARVAAGGDPAGEKQATMQEARDAERERRDNIEMVVDTFVTRYARAHHKMWKETERLLKKHVVGTEKEPVWRGRRLSEIGRADVHDLLDGIIDKGTENRPNRILANRVLSHLHRLCDWAVERGIITTSPVEKMKPPAAETSRDRVLSDDELRMLWRATEDIGWPFEGFVKLLVLTAQRRDEVAGMTRSELDLPSKTWTLPRSRSKNDTEHTVPLSSAASAVIESLPQIMSRQEFLFTTTGARPISGFSSAKTAIDARILKSLREEAEEAGKPIEEVEALPRWTLHDLRRTAASGMARLGTPIHVVEAVLNHRSGTIRGVARIYNRYSYEPEKRQALEAWGRYVEALVSDAPASNVVQLAAAR